ncbi:hypothetical protein DYH09_02440 [bacterium CPR1]|nr:hypothetical protein [bacterium CPR1]
MKVAEGKQPISVDLKYTLPVYDRVQLGTMPKDYFDQSPTPAIGEVHFGDAPPPEHPFAVFRQLPRLNPDGTPLVETRIEHLEGAPKNVLHTGLAWGAGAALGGALVGGALGLWLGHPILAATAGALVVGTGVGLWQAKEANKDRVALVWRPHPIETHQMKGFRELVTAGKQNGQDAYYHHFEPILDTRLVGNYQTPHIEHYQLKGDCGCLFKKDDQRKPH